MCACRAASPHLSCPSKRSPAAPCPSHSTSTAAPGVALLLWPYVVDTAVSIAGVAKACKPRAKAAA